MGSMTSQKTRLLEFFVASWLVLSVTALASMYYSLWWKRDRLLYSGKPAREQRVEVFKRAGLNPQILPDMERLAKEWPSNIHYHLGGDRGHQSYVKYLLSPRIPSGGSDYRAFIEDDRVSSETPLGLVKRGSVQRRTLTFGWLISLILISGVGYLFSRFAVAARLSYPELTAASLAGVSLAVTLSKVLTGRAQHGMLLLTALGAIGAIWGAVELVRAISRTGPSRWNQFSPGLFVSREKWMLSACCGVIMLATLLSLVLSVIVVPDDWDAWAIWGAKAKVLALGKGPLQDVTYFGHADYPLVWPSVWAFSGWCSGGWEEQWSRGWGPLLLLLTAWQIGNIVSHQTRRRDVGVLCAALFVSIPKAVVVSSWSYAEAPLWLFTVCALGRILNVTERGNDNWSSTLAGFFAVGAGLTKNEGILFACLGFVCISALAGRERWMRAASYAIPVLTLYGPWLWWTRFELKLESSALQGFRFDFDQIAYAMSQAKPACLEILRIWLDVRQWSIVLWALIVGSAFVLSLGDRISRRVLLLPVTMMLVYFAITVFHSRDVVWQTATSWDRLTLQTIPLLIVGVTCGLSSIIEEKRTHR
jgi:hypothetical protein